MYKYILSTFIFENLYNRHSQMQFHVVYSASIALLLFEYYGLIIFLRNYRKTLLSHVFGRKHLDNHLQILDVVAKMLIINFQQEQMIRTIDIWKRKRQDQNKTNCFQYQFIGQKSHHRWYVCATSTWFHKQIT